MDQQRLIIDKQLKAKAFKKSNIIKPAAEKHGALIHKYQFPETRKHVMARRVRLVTINIESNVTGHVLSNEFDIPKECWTQKNKS